jgi:hypothetical protein
MQHLFKDRLPTGVAQRFRRRFSKRLSVTGGNPNPFCRYQRSRTNRPTSIRGFAVTLEASRRREKEEYSYPVDGEVRGPPMKKY